MGFLFFLPSMLGIATAILQYDPNAQHETLENKNNKEDNVLEV